VFLPGATFQRTLEPVQNYDTRKFICAPEAIDSRPVHRDGDFFKVFPRLPKRKIVTVILNTEYDVTCRPTTATMDTNRLPVSRIERYSSEVHAYQREVTAWTSVGPHLDLTESISSTCADTTSV
jgi:hypothetical protein